ncbi:ssd1p-like RNAseII [Cryptosporidium canis]|uniref:Ssd1p-like RNAseII n=1 Tax=Cryptosporidium canis TaxID=195482 RepID=A0ABQ8P308_9CRYT|nr:ssd1p-like RNAseII [Cryptosporidium canis]
MANKKRMTNHSLPKNAIFGIYEGKIRFVNPVEAFVTIENGEDDHFEIYVFTRNSINGAMHGDVVQVKAIEIFEARFNRRKKTASGGNTCEEPAKPQAQKDVENEPNPGQESPSKSDEEPNLGEDTSDEESPDRESPSKSESKPETDSKRPKPRYVGKVLKIVESVTKRAPIVGLLRPASYSAKKKGASKKKDPSVSEATIRSFLKGTGVNDNELKIRFTEPCADIPIETKRYSFVPIRRVYPIIHVQVNRRDLLNLIGNQNKTMRSNFLFGIVIDVHPTTHNRSVRLARFYGSCTSMSAVMLGLLDGFGLNSHMRAKGQSNRASIQLSAESYDWETQSDRKLFDPKEYRVLTIDPPSARDLDDAIHIQFDNESKTYEVGIHIADVYHFLRANKGLLEDKVKELCTSVYLPHTSLPMLPPELSSDLCSLLPSQKRPTLSVVIRVSQSGEVVGEPQFLHGIIQSTARFSYDDVDTLFEIMDELDQSDGMISPAGLDKCAKTSKVSDILSRSMVSCEDRVCVMQSLLMLRDLNKILRNTGSRCESIRLLSSSYVFNFTGTLTEFAKPILNRKLEIRHPDSNNIVLPNIELHMDILTANPNQLKGLPMNITALFSNAVSHSIIEELMLLANKTAARFIQKRRPDSNLIIRVHDKISDVRLGQLVNYLRKRGLDDIFEENTSRSNIVSGMRNVYKKYGLILYCTISEMLRDIFSSAKYKVYDKNAQTAEASTEHFGLNTDMYTHFTSPIRRAVDIVIHQIVYDIIDEKPVSDQSKSSSENESSDDVFSAEDIHTICKNSNINSKASKTFSRLVPTMTTRIPSICCIYKIKPTDRVVYSVLLYPTDLRQVIIVDEKTFDSNNTMKSLLMASPALPFMVRMNKEKIELHWRLPNKYANVEPENMRLYANEIYVQYLDDHNQGIKHPFQHNLSLDCNTKMVIQNIRIWSYLPVYIIQTKIQPERSVIMPISPLDKQFQEMVLFLKNYQKKSNLS